MRANHNHNEADHVAAFVVINIFKDTKWEQITTFSLNSRHILSCYQYFQRYEMRANHNESVPDWSPIMLLSIFSKIRNESKSQPSGHIPQRTERCYQYFQRYEMRANHNAVVYTFFKFKVVINIFKDTKWEQITTIPGVPPIPAVLLSIFSKIRNESKSQRAACHC